MDKSQISQQRRFVHVVSPFILAVAFVLLGVGLAQASAPKATTSSIIYVDASATGANTGLSWTDAYTDLQDALTTAISGTQIYVTEGIYKPSNNPTDRIATFQLVDGVGMYGGFPIGGLSFENRDWNEYITILSGDLDDNDSESINPNDATRSDNSFSVLGIYNVGSSTIIDGFIITAGNANGSVDPYNEGGGLHINSGNPIIKNVIFENNSSSTHGGGMIVISGNPSLENVTFRNNEAYSGGGLYVFNGNPTLSNTNFTNNSAITGGGMSVSSNSNPILQNCVFESNNASNSGGGIYNTSAGNPTLNSIIFVNNSASSFGGGMYNSNSSPELWNIYFESNSASSGGGMANVYSNAFIVDSVFNRNFASNGGGLYNVQSNPEIITTIIYNNSATQNGGGIYNSTDGNLIATNVILYGNSASNGGGMYNVSNIPILRNVTFSGNFATFGGGIYNTGLSEPQIFNNIIWGNISNNTVSGEQIFNNSSQPFFHNSLVQESGGSNSNWNTYLGTDGGGNLDANPNFIRNPSPGVDTVWGTDDDDSGNLRLQSASPAIDAGDNTVVPTDTQDLDDDGNTTEPIPYDLAGSPRFIDIITTPDMGNGTPPIVDMGAYETQPFLSIVKSAIPNPVGPGQEITYRINIHNAGPETAIGVIVTDTMPISVTVTGISSTIQITSVGMAPIYVWQLPNLPLGALETITITGVVSTVLDGGEILSNTVEISANEVDPYLGDNQATVPLYVTEIIYVDENASGANNGKTWDNAYINLQDALGRAYAGTQIWVATGEYQPTSGMDRTATFEVQDGVKVYGGFPSGGSIFAERDPAAYPTVLSGDIDDNDTTDPIGVITNASQIVGDNSYHVVTADGVRDITLLDGFTITGGQADDAGHTNGGGLLNLNGSELRLMDVVFKGNYAIYGGGLYNSASQPTLVDVTFCGNAAQTYGGGLYTDSSAVSITNATFCGNRVNTHGGGFYNGGSDSTLNNVLFVGNYAGSHGGGVLNTGGSSTFDNVTVGHNRAGNLAGGMYSQSNSTPDIKNSIFWGNTRGVDGSLSTSNITSEGGSIPVFRHSLIQEAFASGIWNGNLGADAGGNLDADPAFVATPDPGHDEEWGTLDDDYGDLHLQAQSAAIDAGDNAAVALDSQDLDGDDETSEPAPYDLDGNNRFTDVTTTPDTGVGPAPVVDMGAYEAQLRLQVRVTQEDSTPVDQALIYHLPVAKTQGAEPIGGTAQPLTTNSQGMIQAPGGFQVGDRLLAAWPVTVTNGITSYQTSANITLTGLDWQTITDTEIVQHLVVSANNPLTIFDLDVSLEWDARPDNLYLDRLTYDLQRTSELLFDWTNGQVALGKITVFHEREHWNEAHIRVYASNRLRPLAAKGGIVTEVITDPLTTTVSYYPGQVHIGATWNRFGDPGGSLEEDWARTLAHELGHYLLHLDDNYLGFVDGVLVTVEGCPGAMSDPYSDNDFTGYDEFHPDLGWLPACEDTLSHQTTGRSDWSTIEALYPALDADPENYGPNSLPLAVTQVEFSDPEEASTALEIPLFYLRKLEGGTYQPTNNARAFLFQDDRLTDLGSPLLDQVLARGASPGDRLCVYDLNSAYSGCETITAVDEELALVQQTGWQPDVTVSPVTSATLELEATLSGVTPTATVQARIYPLDDPAPTAITLTLTSTPAVYTGTFELEYPSFDGYVLVWVAEAEPRREIVTDYSLGGNPGPRRGRVGRIGPRRGRVGRLAPVVSADGQAIIFGENLDFDESEFFILQTTSSLPEVPSWVTVVGQAYRLSSSPAAPDLNEASLLISYLGSDVPAGEENWLKVYFWDGNEWAQLDTHLDTYQNVASVASQGEGIYALMSTLEIPLYTGWNNFPFPIDLTRSITLALQSIDGEYNSVCQYVASDTANPWHCYGENSPTWVNDLNNFEFGSYWIYSTRNQTLLFKGASENGIQDIQTGLQVPPAIYYGNTGPDINQSGLSVKAWINGNLCGQGQTLEANGKTAYAIDVFADDFNRSSGCGTSGSIIQITIDGQEMTPSQTWNHNQFWEVNLTAKEHKIFLPLVLR
jgi:uncharacterized repeat protein (TIGR01451 family)